MLATQGWTFKKISFSVAIFWASPTRGKNYPFWLHQKNKKTYFWSRVNRNYILLKNKLRLKDILYKSFLGLFDRSFRQRFFNA
jgi:hypothetical protein